MNREESLKNWESLKAFDADFARIVGEAGKEFDCPTVAVIYGNTVAWDGWLKCFEPRQREQRPQQQALQQAAPAQTGGFDDDIPF